MMKGTHHTEDSKQKIRKNHVSWNKGKHNVQKYDITGEKNPFYGKHHTLESKQKIREKHLGKKAWNKGKKYEEVFSSEKSEKLKQITSEARKGKTYDELYGIEKATELKQKWKEIGLSTKGKHRSETTKQKVSIAQKELWKNDDYARRVLSGNIPSGPELYLDFLLQNYFPDEWKFVGDGQVTIGGLCPDFINYNGKKKIIELFGEHWHKGNNIPANRTEQKRKEIFKEIGYSTLVIWENELSDEKNVVDKISNFLEAKR